MIFNNIDIGIGIVEAYYDYSIRITSKDNKTEILFSFNQQHNDIINWELNKKENIVKYLHWDTSLQTEEDYYLFDISKDTIYLTKLENNKYRLEVNIINPEMIIKPKEVFYSIKIDVAFSFILDKEPKDNLLKKDDKKHISKNVLEVLKKCN